jgi:hypothetical protein
MPDSLLPDFMVQRDIFLEKLNLAGDPVQDTQQQMIDEKKRMEEMKAIKRENAK